MESLGLGGVVGSRRGTGALGTRGIPKRENPAPTALFTEIRVSVKFS